ncbi:hypothetical protein [Isoptericola sp. NPDC057653]|uniref:hypothetical protein n=1 Tax=Isoptericola sp. NPDC057653 TaxID=3346195 RepID=UPI0036831A1C
MATTYADIWAEVPPALRDRLGAAEPLTAEEWAALLRAGVPATTATRRDDTEPTGWRLPVAFRTWLADVLEAEADVASGADDEARAVVLRERAARLRAGR